MTLISLLVESEREGERQREWEEESRMEKSGRGWEKVEQANGPVSKIYYIIQP